MGVDPLSLAAEGAVASEAAGGGGGLLSGLGLGAKGAESAGALAPAVGAGGEAAGGLGALDSVAAGLTPAGGAIIPSGEAAGSALAGAGAGLGGDVLAGAGLGADAGGFNAIDAAAGIPGVNGAPAAAAPAIAAPSSALPQVGGGSAAGFAGPSGGSGIADASAFNAIDAAAGQAGVNGAPAAAGAATPAAGAASPASGGISSFFGANKGLLTSLGAGIAGTALAPQLSKLINKVPQQGQLDALAAQEASVSQQQQQLSNTLTDPLVSGKLPAGAETTVKTAIDDAIGTTKARYANLDLSGSTMEADAISNIQNQATGLRFQIAQQMAQTGEAAIGQASSALGLQDQVYNQLMQAQISQDNNLQTAIARFAAAAAGGGNNKSGVNVQLGGTSNA